MDASNFMGISSDEFEALVEECYYAVRDCDEGMKRQFSVCLRILFRLLMA